MFGKICKKIIVRPFFWNTLSDAHFVNMLRHEALLQVKTPGEQERSLEYSSKEDLFL